MTITVITVALVLMAVMCWAGTILGIRSGITGQNGLVVAYFPDMLSRYVTAGLGTVALILAAGVYRRHLLARRAGLEC